MAIAAPFPAARAIASTPRPVRARSRSAVTHTPELGGLRLTRRGRLALTIASSVFLLLVVLLSGRISADAGTSLADQGRTTGVVVVQPGENLWQIAKALAPTVDPRETVTVIRELNGLSTSTVVAGQSILVPVASTAGR